MGCRNSPLTIKPYPMKIRGEYIALFRAFTLITNEIFFGRINSTKDIRKVGETLIDATLYESSMPLFRWLSAATISISSSSSRL